MSVVPAVLQKRRDPALSTAICGLLKLAGNGAPAGSLLIAASYAHGNSVGVKRLEISPTALVPRVVPESLFNAIAGEGWPLQLLLATRERAGRLRSLSVLAATVDVPHIRPNARGRYIVDRAGMLRAFDRADKFLPTTALIITRTSVSAVWALEVALDLTSRGREADALELLRGAAAAVGARTPMTVADAGFPLPGFDAGKYGGDDLVDCASLDLGRTYTVDAIKAAIAAGRE